MSEETYTGSLERKFREIFLVWDTKIDDRWQACENAINALKSIDLNRVIDFYAREIWVHETCVPEGFSEEDDIEESKRELKNIVETARFLSGSKNAYTSEIDQEFVLDVHAKVCDGLHEFNPGKYRQGPASAGGRVFPEREHVPEMMERLLNFVNVLLNAVGMNFKRRLIVAAFFFWAFLEIQPFQGGNGRTARLLFSHILRDVTTVPISLFNTTERKNQRRSYINALRSGGVDDAPTMWMDYVLDCISSNTQIYKVANII